MAKAAAGGRIERFGCGLRHVALGLAALALVCALAVAAGALPFGFGPAQPGERNVTIYVASNGFHSDIVLPTVSAGRDWRPLLAASPLTEPYRDAPWIAFGWGAETAYTELGTLADLSLGLILKATAFDRSVVHVQPVAAVRTGTDLRSFTISEAGYRALVGHVEASLQLDETDGPVILSGVSHGNGDAFLRGCDRFWLLRSCNVWTGEGLRKAGLPIGLWTPLAQSLMWSLGPGDAGER
ncbi:TIGR02117 family protein [Bosea sp. LjRoot237]|uniref:TIGR02117 family protein n=1 Tax=Bosea sp. LjRoot237 TaxID=3342292 RepID=UPI003ECDDA7A